MGAPALRRTIGAVLPQDSQIPLKSLDDPRQLQVGRRPARPGLLVAGPRSGVPGADPARQIALQLVQFLQKLVAHPDEMVDRLADGGLSGGHQPRSLIEAGRPPGSGDSAARHCRASWTRMPWTSSRAHLTDSSSSSKRR